MPELPEVEVTRLSFASRIEGAQIRAVHMGKALRWPMGIDPDELQGRVVVAVRRRGKYLLIDLATPAGAAHGLLLVHLGMSGSLSFAPQVGEAGKHDHFTMATTRGTLRLNDPRRFGAVVYASAENDSASCKLLGGLGVEPLSNDFDAKAFHQALQLRKTAIKQVLLAGIRPTVRACNISAPRAAKLHGAIRDVLQAAVNKGGSTLRDFSSAEGKTGYFQLQAAVYGRAGEVCRVCNNPIKQMRQGQRSTFFCATCQKY